MKKFRTEKLEAMAISLIVLALGASAASANTATQSLCKYYDVEATPTRLYQRIALDPKDFYSPVRSIQFCDRSDKKGSYVVIEEELIRGFQVVNPPLTYSSGISKWTGLPFYILDKAGVAQGGLGLLVSKDGKLMKVYRNNNQLVDVLRLVD